LNQYVFVEQDPQRRYKRYV